VLEEGPTLLELSLAGDELVSLMPSIEDVDGTAMLYGIVV
jgi:hypothetical protein